MVNPEDGRATARAAVLTELRRRGVSHRRFAAEAGIAPGTALDFVNGVRWPISATLAKIETYLGWPPGQIDNLARGLVDPDVTPSDHDDVSGVLLDVDPKLLEGLAPDERDEAITAAKLSLLSTARAIRRSREQP